MTNNFQTQTLLKMNRQGNQLDYTGQTIYVGLDVHKKSWKVAMCTQHTEPHKWPITVKSPFVQNLKKYLTKHYPGGKFKCVYEAGYHGFWIQREMEDYDLPTIVVNPADVPTSDKDRKQKEDKRDARKLAKALKHGDMEGIYIPPKQAQVDRSLVRERYSIAKSLRRVKNQIKSHMALYRIDISEDFTNRHWSAPFIKWLKEEQESRKDKTLGLQLKRLEEFRKLQLQANRQLRNLAKSDSYKTLYELLLSVPGVGLITAMLLITELIEMSRFSSFDHLCSYTGYIPRTNSSGDREKRGHLTNRRNKRLRAALVESSWAAIKSDEELMAKYITYKEKMTGQEAIIRIARILLRRIRYVWLNGQKYQKKQLSIEV